MVKVHAHKSQEQSKSEGWEEHWRGNDAADATAKVARPKLQRDAKTQQKVITSVRRKRAKIAECCKLRDGLWKELLTAKKTCVKVNSNQRGKMGKLPHTVVYHRGKWTRSSCGCHSKKAPVCSGSGFARPLPWAAAALIHIAPHYSRHIDPH